MSIWIYWQLRYNKYEKLPEIRELFIYLLSRNRLVSVEKLSML